ncbi:hypothetical protein B0H15DRAFT_1009151 [Mycena belliarum]|uniref:Protein OS-9 homolog n=1 Tax=Mycena belliarum TaxID=1033014 RepID=A0AAD6XV43_9AGAR|nr:hypothetical protein B0H15DRAFT_1009151 [Mycena belliae]
MLLYLLALNGAAARILHSLPDDPHAFPKYRVSYLDHLPLPAATANRWRAQGLRGGVREFLEQPWDDYWHPPALGNGDDQVSFGVAHEDAPDASDDYTLEHLKMGPRTEYLCLIPKALDAPPPEDDTEDDSTPAHSWSLLLPLAGTCLYHRQPWFTYSYCHNEEIRQFRELIQARPLPPGAHRPEEDPDWESYTLGRAPPTPAPGTDLTAAQQDALAANLELARTAGSRYLVQRWGDGTICDKTGKPREVEVQFHCSMATTDTIAFVKEAKTCAYVLVVHTPRLCGEPGFMSSKEAGEQASISCRQIVAGELPDRSDAAFLPDADHPLRKSRKKPVLPPPAPKQLNKNKDSAPAGKYSEALLKTLDALKQLQWPSGEVEMLNDGDGSVMIQFIEDDAAGGANQGAAAEQGADRILQIMREAGYDIKTAGAPPGKMGKKKKNGDEKQEENDAADRRREVDELSS